MKMKKILITNDDGIHADGLVRLARTAAEFGEVWVVAPDSERSAMSHSVTLRHPIEAWQVDFPVPGVHAYAWMGNHVLILVPGLAGLSFQYGTDATPFVVIHIKSASGPVGSVS